MVFSEKYKILTGVHCVRAAFKPIIRFEIVSINLCSIILLYVLFTINTYPLTLL